MPYKGKPFISGNPLYKEIQYKGESVIQGEPLVNTMKITCKRELPYTRKSLIQGNPLHVETLVK